MVEKSFVRKGRIHKGVKGSVHTLWEAKVGGGRKRVAGKIGRGTVHGKQK